MHICVVATQVLSREQTFQSIFNSAWLLQVQLQNREVFLFWALVINVSAFDHLLFFTVEKTLEDSLLWRAFELLFQTVIHLQLEFWGILLHFEQLVTHPECFQELVSAHLLSADL